MAKPAIEAAPDLASRQQDLGRGSTEQPRGRPHVILVTGSIEPGPRALHSAAWLGRRLGAEMLVVAVVEYSPPRDELVSAWVAAANRVVSATAGRLVRQGVTARGIVRLTQDGEGPATVDDIVEQQEAELVAVTSRRRLWFSVSPAPAVARYLIRAGHTPVLVIPDHRPGPWMRFLAWLQGTRRGTSGMPAGGR